MKTLMIFSKILIILTYFSHQQPLELAYCDDCAFHCCNILKTCSSTESSCYCIEKTCKNGCCKNEKCGSEEECNDTVGLINFVVIIICIFIFVVCASFLGVKIMKKKYHNNAVINIDEANNNENLNIISNNNEIYNSGKKTEGIFIQNVILGQPLEFCVENKDDNNLILEGEPIIKETKPEDK